MSYTRWVPKENNFLKNSEEASMRPLLWIKWGCRKVFVFFWVFLCCVVFCVFFGIESFGKFRVLSHGSCWADGATVGLSNIWPSACRQIEDSWYLLYEYFN